MVINNKFKQMLRRWNGCTIDYDLFDLRPILDKINDLETDYVICSDSKLKLSAGSIRDQVNSGIPLDTVLPQAFALVRETARRTIQLRPYDVQVLGAIALHRGKIAEMQTGEGKTLVAVLPAFLNALTGNSVHILTFNDYLARRDARWMGPIYQFLGMSVGCVQEEMSTQKRQQAYRADITYLTAKEAGFDYLRDSLCYDVNEVVHRPFHLAIIDEADSILIDEARIPLVIAGSTEDVLANPYLMAEIARQLEQEVDFLFDDYGRNIILTDRGQHRAEQKLQCANLYDPENLDILTRLYCALHVEYLLHKDVDYIVRNGTIELVDEFTGRVADKRRWPDGLQAALEAKERIQNQSRGQILNQITLQHFLGYYPKICGMTATAQAGETEFKTFYNLDIAVIPPHAPNIRIDHPDIIFQTKEEKHDAIIKEIVGAANPDRPILVGTSSVEESETLAGKLSKTGLVCSVLNAKNDEREAEIVAEAGRLGAITISTNMAGRGTDIRLGGSDEGEKRRVQKLGGLYVIGTNKHESERIDQQLRGRAGRQGDPGESRYFTSLQDDLMVKYRLDELIPKTLVPAEANGELDLPFVRKETARIQRICDGQNLEIKKTLFKYSELLEKQRTVLFERRRNVLFHNNADDFYKEFSPKHYGSVCSRLGEEHVSSLCRTILLYKIDENWVQYLADIADIREGIHLKRLGGRDPYIEFQKISVQRFDDLLDELDKTLIELFESLDGKNGEINLEALGIKAPAATWTYLINDNPFENQLGLQLIGNMGMQVAAGIWGPLFLLKSLFHKKEK